LEHKRDYNKDKSWIRDSSVPRVTADRIFVWNAYGILVVKPEGKRPLGRQRRRWMSNIKMDLREIGWGGMGWIDVAQDKDQWRALANTVMNLRVLQNAEKFLSSYTTCGFSRRAQLHAVRIFASSEKKRRHLWQVLKPRHSSSG
jgi:hypothetical protein